ncbi:MAG: hypothetical protein AAB074_20965 [Planctomycetota bacterium]
MDEEMVRTLKSGFRVFPPWVELVLGTVLAIAGLSLCLALLLSGYIHSIALFLPLVGLFAVFNGAIRQRKKVHLESQIRVVQEKGDALVNELAMALRSNQPASRIFQDLGIDDDRIRAYLLFLAKGRARSAGPP